MKFVRFYFIRLSKKKKKSVPKKNHKNPCGEDSMLIIFPFGLKLQRAKMAAQR